MSNGNRPPDRHHQRAADKTYRSARRLRFGFVVLAVLGLIVAIVLVATQ